jgi:hypothetical protein
MLPAPRSPDGRTIRDDQSDPRQAWGTAGIMPVTNPVESTFATVRLRTTKTKGCLSRRTALTMVFRLCQSAQRRWRRLDDPTRLGEVVRRVRFVDGEPQLQDAA